VWLRVADSLSVGQYFFIVLNRIAWGNNVCVRVRVCVWGGGVLVIYSVLSRSLWQELHYLSSRLEYDTSSTTAAHRRNSDEDVI